MAAGPWFTVRHQDDDWQPLGQIWLSDGRTDGPAVVEARIRLVRDLPSPPPLPHDPPVALRHEGRSAPAPGETP
jgi:hypothetical protein